jgi:hypothetical protein
MTTLSATMYTLGQLARAIYPDGDIPPKLLDTLLAKPATGFALLVKQRRRSHADEIARLTNALPADLVDPPGGTPIEDQGAFWTGWYHYMAALDRSRHLGPEHLARAGRLLYGERWQTDLARELSINDRRVRAWMQGERSIPAGVWADVAVLLRQRQSEGLALLAEMWGEG